jgi:DNA-binding transcriptional LysR family regulator
MWTSWSVRRSTASAWRYLGKDRAAPHLKQGSLVRVLEPWCQPFPGFFLYYPRRRQQPASLAALIETLRI